LSLTAGPVWRWPWHETGWWLCILPPLSVAMKSRFISVKEEEKKATTN